MPPHTIDCPDTDAADPAHESQPTNMRYDMIVRARKEIRAGLYENEAYVDHLLDCCVDRIASDLAT